MPCQGLVKRTSIPCHAVTSSLACLSRVQNGQGFKWHNPHGTTKGFAAAAWFTLNLRGSKHYCSYRTNVSNANSESPPSESEADVQIRSYVKALLLAWFASQNSSLFAAKCMIETTLEIFSQGYSYDQVQVALSLVSLESGGQLLEPIQQDILLSWVAIVMITLEEAGAHRTKQGHQAGSVNEMMDDGSSMSAGLRGFVTQTITMFLNGLTFQRLQLTQSLANVEGVSPAVKVMQQNTRLVIITLEVLRDNDVSTSIRLEPKVIRDDEDDMDRLTASAMRPADTGNQPVASSSSSSSSPPAEPGVGSGGKWSALRSQHMDGEENNTVDWMISNMDYVYSFRTSKSLEASASEIISLRSSSLRLLISFMGSVLRSLYAVNTFVEYGLYCYTRGWTARQIFMQLRDEEFLQSGGALPNGVAGYSGVQQINAQLFARWLSLLYMTFAQVGVPRPESSTCEEGWAWTGTGTGGLSSSAPSEAIEAANLSLFVENTLQLKAQQEQAAEFEESKAARYIRDVSAKQPQHDPWMEKWKDLTLSKIPDEDLLNTSPTASIIAQQISIIHLAAHAAQRQITALANVVS